MELLRALGALAEPPHPETARLAALLELPVPSSEEYTRLFLFELYPFASVYLGDEGMLGGEARDRIAGFWRALGEPPPAEPDHLAVLLSLYAHLADLERKAPPERAAVFRRPRAALLWEHLLSWVPIFLDKLQQTGPPAYVAWGGLVREVLEREAWDMPYSGSLPLHLRSAPPAWDAAGARPDVLVTMLTPVRSGLILTRSDVGRAARDLGVGLRAGERRYALHAMASQDPGRLVRWLAEYAREAAEAHRRLNGWLGPVADFWARRARNTADYLANAQTSPPCERAGIDHRAP